MCRSGGLVATAWAAMRTKGWQGFQDDTKAIMKAVKAFKKAVEDEEGLEILGAPISTVVAFVAAKRSFNIHAVRRLFVYTSKAHSAYRACRISVACMAPCMAAKVCGQAATAVAEFSAMLRPDRQ